MIIACNNCNKKFHIDSSLIPNKGRLLQCASCDHKWFFKKEVLEEKISRINEDTSVDNINIFEQNNYVNQIGFFRPSQLILLIFQFFQRSFQNI